MNNNILGSVISDNQLEASKYWMVVKRMIFLFLILAVCCLSCDVRKEVKQKTVESLSPEKVKSFVALGQLWGFLKYHHPAVTEGNCDWDMELIKLIPAVEQAKNEAQWKELLDNWIDSLPPVSKNADIEFPTQEVKVKPDYGILFSTEYFNSETIDKIKYILNNAAISSSRYYMSRNSLSIMNEPAYEELLYPDFSYRLLALFRYWNFVNYFFPYRELCDQKWSSVLENMLPEFVFAANQEQYVSACLKLVTKIDDSHGFFYLNDWIWALREGALKVPFETRFIEDKLVVTMYTGKDAVVEDKIKIGDIITAIDGEVVDDIIKRKWPYIPASNNAVKFREISSKILRGNSDTVLVTVQRDSEYFDLKVARYDSRRLKIPNYFNPHPEEEGYRILDNNIGYVLPSSCKVKNRDEGVKKVLSGTKGLIIDLRCYPDDLMASAFIRKLEHTSLDHSQNARANASFPGYFFIKTYPNHTEHRKNQQNFYKNRVVVIVNEYTQSAAEDSALEFQLCSNVTVIGSTTAGADGTVCNLNLPGGIVTYMTSVGVYYPDGGDLQRSGVRIDEIVKPTISGIKSGKDELLDRAIEIIENSKEN